MSNHLHRIFPDPKVTSSNCLFCLTNRPKPKHIQINTIEDEDDQQIFTFVKLKPVN